MSEIHREMKQTMRENIKRNIVYLQSVYVNNGHIEIYALQTSFAGIQYDNINLNIYRIVF